MGTVVLQKNPEERNLPKERQSPWGQLCYRSLHAGICACVGLIHGVIMKTL